MAGNPTLFTATQWLLRAAMLVCAFGAVILCLCLGGLVLVGTEMWVPKEIPAVLDGVPRAHVLMIVFLAVTAGLAMLVLALLVFQAIHQIVESAIGGDPFIVSNADRLARVGWLLVGIYGVQLLMNGVMTAIVPKQLEGHFRFDLGNDLSPQTIIAILLVFVLAQIFRHGARMRADLEGTV